MLHKIDDSPGGVDNERRYSPAVCTGIDVRKVNGFSDLCTASTSFVERQRMSMRMGMRRFTGLTNGPAMAAGVERRVGTHRDIAALLD
jgi:hypothetical protein